MTEKKTILLTAVTLVSLISSCSSTNTEETSTIKDPPNNSFIAPVKLGPDSHIVKDSEKALAAYNSFASKIIKSEEMESSANSVYSPLSHYLCEATIGALVIDSNESFVSSLGADSSEELSSFVDKLVRLESLCTERPDDYGIVEMANMVANFDITWPKEKIDLVTNVLHAAYLNDYQNYKEPTIEWKKELSHEKMKNPSPIELNDGMIAFISGLYVDLPYELALNEKTQDAPFDGKGLYPFLKGDTYGSAYEDEDVLVFAQSCRASDYEIHYVMPKKVSLDEYIRENDYNALFEKVSPKDKYTMELPSLEIASEWSLDKLKKSANLPSIGPCHFLPNEIGYDAIESKQNINLGFKYDGIKAYAESKIVMIPESVPVGLIRLNRPFAFEIVGRKGATLIHGRVKTF